MESARGENMPFLFAHSEGSIILRQEVPYFNVLRQKAIALLTRPLIAALSPGLIGGKPQFLQNIYIYFLMLADVIGELSKFSFLVNYSCKKLSKIQSFGSKILYQLSIGCMF